MKKPIVFALALAAFHAAAAETYRCTQPDGRIAFADRPCPGAASEAIEVKPNTLDNSEQRRRWQAEDDEAQDTQDRQDAQAEEAGTAPAAAPARDTRACQHARAELEMEHRSSYPSGAKLIYARDRQAILCALPDEPSHACQTALHNYGVGLSADGVTASAVAERQGVERACRQSLPAWPEARRRANPPPVRASVQPYAPPPGTCSATANGLACPDGFYPSAAGGGYYSPHGQYCYAVPGGMECPGGR